MGTQGTVAAGARAPVAASSLPRPKITSPCQQKLDRLGWSVGMTFNAYGCKIGIRARDRQTLDELAARLPVARRPMKPNTIVDRLYSVLRVRGEQPGAIRRYNLLYAGWILVARTLEPDELFDALESDLKMYVGEWAHRHIFVHAGVVGWRGRAIVVPGRSLSGKSTLVAALVKAGATYYSDEYAVLDARGRVHPYAAPLALRESPTARQRRITAESLGGRTGTKPLPVGLVLISRYRKGAVLRPKPLSPGEAALALLANTLPARRRPAATMVALQQTVRGAILRKSLRGEAEQSSQSILSLLSPLEE